MCGIAGIAGPEPADRIGRVRAMRDLLVHRGPDSAGEHSDERVALGIRRLRIIDLVTGEQPQSNEDGTIWTVFNGEIYNFRELRDELTARGHRLVTQSDTEVIPHLYEEFGERFVARLAGMFAFALWDSRTGTLLLARDRLGKKPLLYSESGGEIAFASEHASLLAGLAERRGIDPRAIRLYLRFGYVPAPHDAYAGVRKLLPAHYLVWREGTSRIERYWSLPEGTIDISEEDATAEFRRLFERAVARRLISDVPLGALLSGGVDSSAVVATMSRLRSTVSTFSIGFEEADFSELAHARRVAERFGTDHHEFVVRPAALDVLPTLVRHYGEPYADSSAVPTYYLAKLTREHVTVALDGDGGDELFAGYDRYAAARYAAWLDTVPVAIRRAAAAVAQRALPDSLTPTAAARRARRFLAASVLPPRDRYFRWLGIFDEAGLRDLLAPDFERASSTGLETLPANAVELDGRGPVGWAQTVDLLLYLPDDLLVKMDIASMANSLEVRCPFLDHELVEFAARLPLHLKIRGRDRKYLVKRAFAGVIPHENMYRRKQGFGIPVGQWARGELRPLVEETLLATDARSRDLFQPDRLRTLVREHTEGRVDRTQQVWSLLMLELWLREAHVERAVA